MIFRDGTKKAGFFAGNVYNKPITTKAQFLEFFETSDLVKKVPQVFKEEINDYVV